MGGMTQFGFGRERRLRRRSDFVRVQGSARRVTTRHYLFLVSVQPSLETGAQALESTAPEQRSPRDDAPRAQVEGVIAPSKRRARLGIVVTRRLGNAVARNRIKRVCRECFRHWPDLLPDGVDLVIVARQGADQLGLSEARAEWSEVSRVLRRRADEALAQAARMPHVLARPKPGP